MKERLSVKGDVEDLNDNTVIKLSLQGIQEQATLEVAIKKMDAYIEVLGGYWCGDIYECFMIQAR